MTFGSSPFHDKAKLLVTLPSRQDTFYHRYFPLTICNHLNLILSVFDVIAVLHINIVF